MNDPYGQKAHMDKKKGVAWQQFGGINFHNKHKVCKIFKNNLIYSIGRDTCKCYCL